jgi:hypothetical protein
VIWVEPRRLAGAVFLLGALAAAVVVAAGGETATAARVDPGVAQTFTTVRPPPSAPIAALGTPATSPATTQQPPAEVVDPRVGAVIRSLRAWERFGAGGDPPALQNAFHPEGPQHARFETEAGASSRSGPVSLGLRSVLGVASTEAAATVDVVVDVRTDALTDIAVWRFHLVERNGGWITWTVEAIPAAAATPVRRE